MTDIVEMLREVPVWMVGKMTPGWQQHGATAYEAADEITALRARVAELEGALGDIARQRLTSEMDDEQAEHADYEGAYDTIVGIARAALGDKA